MRPQSRRASVIPNAFRREAPAVLLLVFGTLLFANFAAVSAADHAASCQAKLQHIQQNAAAAQPDPKPTVLTEDEINDYFAAGKVQLPKGVKSVRFKGAPNVITAYAKVDFDRLTEGRRSVNPLLALFTGVHDIVAMADANGAGGIGRVHVQSVTLDGNQIPRVALEFLIEHYVKPKYPAAGMDSRFRLPDRIHSAEVGTHKLTLRQK